MAKAARKTPGAGRSDGKVAASPAGTEIKPASLFALDDLDVDALCLCLTSDLRPLRGAAGLLDWRMCGRLSRMLIDGALSGDDGVVTLTWALDVIPVKQLFVFGWGPSDKLSAGAADRFARMVDVLLRAKVDSVAIALPAGGEGLVSQVGEALGEPLGGRLKVVFEPEPTD